MTACTTLSLCITVTGLVCWFCDLSSLLSVFVTLFYFWNPPHTALSRSLRKQTLRPLRLCAPQHVPTYTHAHSRSLAVTLMFLNVVCEVVFFIDLVLNGGWCSALMWYWKHLRLALFARRHYETLLHFSSANPSLCPLFTQFMGSEAIFLCYFLFNVFFPL